MKIKQLTNTMGSLGVEFGRD